MDTLPTPLPLFPLHSVLFPGGRLPLRIFEVRYLDMVKRCFEAGTPFAVVCLMQGSEVRRAEVDEAFHPIGTLARIATLERPRPGLMSIRCNGTRRVRLRSSTRLPHGLWVGEGEPIDDDAPVPVPDDLAPAATHLQHLLRHMQAQGFDPADLPLQPPYRWDDCGWLANRWAELLPMAADAKQRLMSLDNPLLRLELVADMLARGPRPG